MPQAIKPLAQYALTGALADAYVPPTQPPNLVAVIQSIIICNITGGALTFTLRMGTGVLTTANSIFEAFPIAANGTLVYGSSAGMLFVLLAGQHLQGLCSSAGNVIVTLCGEEYS